MKSLPDELLSDLIRTMLNTELSDQEKTTKIKQAIADHNTPTSTKKKLERLAYIHSVKADDDYIIFDMDHHLPQIQELIEHTLGVELYGVYPNDKKGLTVYYKKPREEINTESLYEHDILFYFVKEYDTIRNAQRNAQRNYERGYYSHTDEKRVWISQHPRFYYQ